MVMDVLRGWNGGHIGVAKPRRLGYRMKISPNAARDGQPANSRASELGASLASAS
jgi:hypothetical protein